MGSDPFQLAKQNVGGGGGGWRRRRLKCYIEGEVKSRLRGSNREKSCCIYGGK